MLAASSPNPSNLPSAAHHARRAPTGGAPTQVLKRDGRTQPFDRGRIERALALCFYDINERPKTSLLALAERVITRLAATPTATVEQIQDVVVTILREQGEQAAVAHYTTYRSAAAAARDERPIPEAVRERYRRDALYFPSALQQFQFYDKYARFNTRQGMRETWAETVSRAVAYLYELASAHGMQASDTIWTTLRHAILGMQVMPSMRLLAMAGPAARRQNLALFNCAYLPVDDPAAFGEALLISMSGCGVGYSVERQYVERFPRVQRANMTGARHLVIADTTEGWKEAVDVGVAAWLRGGDVLYDYTQIRPAGAPLAIKGGQASGPAALREALAHIKSIIRARAGATLRPLDAHDIMCHIGSAAVSGGVRRTAMLALFDADDTEMLTCKDGDLSQQQQRYNANNSMVWPDTGVTQVDLMRQMVAMAAEGRGEPGIFNRAAARATKPERRAAAEFGVNPCFTGETKVWTIDGARRFDELVGQTVPVLTQGDDGLLHYRLMTNIVKTRRNTPVYTVTLRSKRGKGAQRTTQTSSFTATPDHKIFLKGGDQRTVADLRAGDSLMSTYRVLANSKGYRLLRNTAGDVDMEHRIAVSYRMGERPAYPQWHVHHLDGDKTNNAPDNLSVLDHAEHNALKMRGDHNPVRRIPECNHLRYDRYKTRGFSGRTHTDETRAQMSASHLRRREESVNHTVVSVEYAGTQDVYDGTVEGTHRFYIMTEEDGGVLVHNCGEIFLRPFGLCNLSSVVARPNDTEESLLTKVRLASFIGTVQSLATHYPGLRPIWSQNAREERLLGVDITGQADCPLLRDNPTLLARLRQEASDVNQTYATYFDIPRSAAITCVKPSGNSSQLLDCASGLHPRFARYYIRNVRLAAASPLYHVLRGAGVPLTPENGQTFENATTWVASFPVAAPEGALVRSEVSALDQCNAWLLLKQHYTDHNPSVTITYAPDELLALTAWLYEHQALIGGMAFLPASNPQYDLLPYTEVTREEYLRAAAAFPEVDYAKLYRYETTDATTAASELACMSGQCDLI